MSIDQHGDAKLEGVSLRSLPKVSLHDHLDGGVRPARLFRQVVDIGRRVCGNGVVGRAGANAVDVLGPALLCDLKTLAESERHQRESVGNDIAQNARALTAAGDEQAEYTVTVNGREALIA